MSETRVVVRPDSEAMGCNEIRNYPVLGEKWARFKQAFSEAVEDRRGFILLYGFYGSGKTLFIRRMLADYVSETNLILPIYMPLRRLQKVTGDVRELALAAIEYMLSRLSRGWECGGEWLQKQLDAARREIRGKKVFNGYIDLLEYLSSRVSPIPVLILDELEALVEYSRQAVWAPEEYRAFVTRILDLLGEAYNLAPGGHGYFVIVSSVYKLSTLLLELVLNSVRWALSAEAIPSERLKVAVETIDNVARYAVERIGGLLHPGIVRDAFQLVELARRVREQRANIHELSENLAKFYVALLDYQEMRGDVVEPGLAERLGSGGLIVLDYSGDEYDEMARMFLGEGLEHEERVVYEKLHLPPRILLREGRLKSRVLSGVSLVSDVVAELRATSGKVQLSDRTMVQAHTRRLQRLSRIESMLSVFRRKGSLVLPYSVVLGESRCSKLHLWIAKAAKLIDLVGGENSTLGPAAFYAAVLETQHPWLTSLSTRDALLLALVYTTYCEYH